MYVIQLMIQSGGKLSPKNKKLCSTVMRTMKGNKMMRKMMKIIMIINRLSLLIKTVNMEKMTGTSYRKIKLISQLNAKMVLTSMN